MKSNRLFFLTAVLALSSNITVVFASSERISYHYDRGVSLYDREKYTAAKEEFSKAAEYVTVDDGGDAERTRYYIALCAASLQEAGAGELLYKFVFDYPNSIYTNDVRFALGNVLYDDGDFAGALREFGTVDADKLNYAKRDEYNFKSGYAAYMTGDSSLAYGYFKKTSSGSKFYPHAVYYTSYIDYLNGDLASAKSGFASIAGHAGYEEIIPFYLLQIEFLEGNYPYVVENGEPLFARAAVSRKIEISRILSEAYFHLKDYADALKYIVTYEELGGLMGREEYYIAAYGNYADMQYTAAVEQFNAAAGNGNDALSQNAYFHLADSYLRKQDKRRAMGAFGLAASMDYDRAVKEEAMFNYAKLQYELGGGAFNDAITTFNAFIDEFPQSERIPEAREYLLASYFNSRNYAAAYEAIKLVKNPDNDVKTALQKIAYFRGLEFYEAGDYKTAVEFFNMSLGNQFNPKYTALTKYWLAETYMKEEDYARAMPLYEEYVRLSPRQETEHKMAQYNLGYCNFNTQKWSAAESWFTRFVNLYTDKDMIRADAFNRLGDIAMAGRDYSKAISDYDKAIGIGTQASDYAQYQRAVMLGLADRIDGKTEALRSIIDTGRGEYVDDAMYELGRTYMQRDRFSDAAGVLKELTAKFPSSPYTVSALSHLGLIYQNLGNDTEALKYYKMVAEQFPSTPQAKDAMLGIRNIYVDRNDVDSYFTFARETGIETNVTVVERDSLSFAAADRVYRSGDYSRTINLMENYLNQYEKGGYRADALYAIGDAALHTGDKPKALAAFKEVGAMPSNRYKSLALGNAGKIEFEEKNYEDAAETYRALAAVGVQAAVVREGLEGYVRSALASGNYDLMDAAAGEVMGSGFANAELKAEAAFAKAQSLYGRGEQEASLEYYREVAKDPRTRNGAEAEYRVISILFEQGKYDEAEKEVFSFSEAGSPHQYWMGKAFLVLGDIYIKKNDAFQAKATYQSIIDGYQDQDDGVVDEARTKIKSL